MIAKRRKSPRRSPEAWGNHGLDMGNHPLLWPYGLVKYDNLPIYIYIYT